VKTAANLFAVIDRRRPCVKVCRGSINQSIVIDLSCSTVMQCDVADVTGGQGRKAA